MKPAHKWIEILPIKVRTTALVYLRLEGLQDHLFDCLSSTIIHGFKWKFTAEGKDFWSGIFIAAVLYENLNIGFEDSLKQSNPLDAIPWHPEDYVELKSLHFI